MISEGCPLGAQPWRRRAECLVPLALSNGNRRAGKCRMRTNTIAQLMAAEKKRTRRGRISRWLRKFAGLDVIATTHET